MKVLYIGGTGEISYSCIHEGAKIGQDITILNRGMNEETLPGSVKRITGDLSAPDCYKNLEGMKWDVVCQYRAYTTVEVQRDIDFFAGNCGQYVFISSASVYRKTPQEYIITEETPAENPFWPYSQNKIKCEQLLMQNARKLPTTIIRPSHTYRKNLISAIGGGDHAAWRMHKGKPVIVHGDGTSLWTYTHSDDYAWFFARLLGQSKTIGEIYNITQHMKAYQWGRLFKAVADAIGVSDPKLVCVPSDTLIKYRPDWIGPLWGDKSPSTIFDMTKSMNITGPYDCKIEPEEGLRRVAEFWRKRASSFQPDMEMDALFDKIAGEQANVGT